MVLKQYEELSATLHACMNACNHCFDACLAEDNVKMMAKCIKLTRECADFCGYLGQALASRSPFISEFALICASICEACGNECKEHDHEHCRACATICFACADACKKVA